MAKLTRSTSSKKNNAILKLKIAVEKLQKSLFQARKLSTGFEKESFDGVPKDVKEGQFAVIAVDDYEKRRFIVDLRYLSRPEFVRLLERAADEFGFDHNGALTIPCRPSELELILAQQWQDEPQHRDVDWTSCNTMVETC